MEIYISGSFGYAKFYQPSAVILIIKGIRAGTLFHSRNFTMWCLTLIITEKNLNLEYSYRLTELLRLEGTSGGHPVQPRCSSRVTSLLPRTASRCI